MLKLAGAGLLLFACAGWGFSVSWQLWERMRDLRELRRIAALLRQEISYAGTALPEALAQRESGLQVGTVPEVRFFRQFACALHRQKAPSPALEAFLALLRDQTAAKTGPLSP